MLNKKTNRNSDIEAWDRKTLVVAAFIRAAQNTNAQKKYVAEHIETKSFNRDFKKYLRLCWKATYGSSSDISTYKNNLEDTLNVLVFLVSVFLPSLDSKSTVTKEVIDKINALTCMFEISDDLKIYGKQDQITSLMFRTWHRYGEFISERKFRAHFVSLTILYPFLKADVFQEISKVFFIFAPKGVFTPGVKELLEIRNESGVKLKAAYLQGAAQDLRSLFIDVFNHVCSNLDDDESTWHSQNDRSRDKFTSIITRLTFTTKQLLSCDSSHATRLSDMLENLYTFLQRESQNGFDYDEVMSSTTFVEYIENYKSISRLIFTGKSQSFAEQLQFQRTSNSTELVL